MNKSFKEKKTNSVSKNAIKFFEKSKKPLFILGFGARTSNLNIKKLGNFLEKKNIPFVCTWNSDDLFGTKFKMNLGTIGMSGQRGFLIKLFLKVIY